MSLYNCRDGQDCSKIAMFSHFFTLRGPRTILSHSYRLDRDLWEYIFRFFQTRCPRPNGCSRSKGQPKNPELCWGENQSQKQNRTKYWCKIVVLYHRSLWRPLPRTAGSSIISLQTTLKFGYCLVVDSYWNLLPTHLRILSWCKVFHYFHLNRKFGSL